MATWASSGSSRYRRWTFSAGWPPATGGGQSEGGDDQFLDGGAVQGSADSDRVADDVEGAAGRGLEGADAFVARLVFEAERDMGEQVTEQRALAEGADQHAGHIGRGQAVVLREARDGRLGPVFVAHGWISTGVQYGQPLTTAHRLHCR